MAVPDAPYVFKGWMKIGRTSAGEPSLRFRIVQTDDADHIVATAESPPYDTSTMGQWQYLECRFTTPSRARQAAITIPKPKNASIEVDCHIDDILLDVKGRPL